MENKKTSVFENGLIWFGAAASIAEILTGVALAPLGFAKGGAAILLGHAIGCALLFLAGVIGGKTERSAMETVKMSFGYGGGVLFSSLNIVQLLGWTSIMIYDGAIAADEALAVGPWVWCLVIGGLISVWVLVGIKNLGKLNTAAMLALFAMTIVLGFVIFRGEASPIAMESISFGAAVELSVAMPLSWLPLISDYTCTADRPVAASAVSAAVYGVISSGMYFIGMGAALLTGESDIAKIMVSAGLGIVGLVIVVIATVTTTFLDAYSTGASAQAIFPKLNVKWVAIGATALGTLSAIFFPIVNITDFLYLIGSVFAPMIAVQIADFFLLRRDSTGNAVDIRGILLWLVGFVLYRVLMTLDTPLGSTLPDMAITVILCLITEKILEIFRGYRHEKGKH